MSNKKITSAMFDKIEYNALNSFYKIGFYDVEKNQFNEVARWRNSYNKSSGANYGLLQVWSITFDFIYFESQGGFNTCGGYNKPIANLEGCLYNLKKAHEDFNFSNCGSIESLMNELMVYLQQQYKAKLFLLPLI